MREITEKLEFIKPRAVKVCVQADIKNCPEFKYLVFRINQQENCLGKNLVSSR